MECLISRKCYLSHIGNTANPFILISINHFDFKTRAPRGTDRSP